MPGKPVVIKGLKPGNFVLIDDEPCRVLGVTVSKPGKHGATKARVQAMGLFDNRKHELLRPASADVDTPLIEKKSAQVISVSGDIAQLMDMEDYSTFESTIPEEFQGQIEAGVEISYWRIEGKVLIKSVG